MEPKITFRVLKMSEVKSPQPSVYYKVACSCGCGDNDIMLELEQDQNIISLSMYQQMSWSSYWGKNANIFIRIWRRIKCAFKVLTTGYIEVEGCTILKGEEHIKTFIQALEEGSKYVKEIEDEYK